MRVLIIVVSSLCIALIGCQDTLNEVNQLTRQEILIDDFLQSDVYKDLANNAIELNIEKGELVEITQFEYLFFPIMSNSTDETIVVKLNEDGQWQHFLKVILNGERTSPSSYSGSVTFDFYTMDARSVHSFINGNQTDFQIYESDLPLSRRVISGRITEECESICHVLDCTGRKFESKHWFNQIECSANIVPCMASLALICLDEGCSNSHVKSCNYH